MDFALGGGNEICMSCDIRICSDNAIFGQPEAGLGITPGFGGTQRLARIIAPGLAKEIIYSQEYRCCKAKEVGLVNEVYTQDELLPAAEKLASKIAKNAPIAVRACKKAINEGLDLPMDEAIVLEEKLFGSCFRHMTRLKVWMHSLQNVKRKTSSTHNLSGTYLTTVQS